MKDKYITTQRGLEDHNNVIIINDKGEVLCYSLSSNKGKLRIDEYNKSDKYKVGTHSPTGSQWISLAYVIKGVNQNQSKKIIIEANENVKKAYGLSTEEDLLSMVKEIKNITEENEILYIEIDETFKQNLKLCDEVMSKYTNMNKSNESKEK